MTRIRTRRVFIGLATMATVSALTRLGIAIMAQVR